MLAEAIAVVSDDWPHEFAHYKLADADVLNRVIAQAAVRFVYASRNDTELARKIKEWKAL